MEKSLGYESGAFLQRAGCEVDDGEISHNGSVEIVDGLEVVVWPFYFLGVGFCSQAAS